MRRWPRAPMKTAEDGGDVKIITLYEPRRLVGLFDGGDNVFRCTVCGADGCHEERVEEVFHLGDRYVLVDNMPAVACNRCADMTFSADTVERVRVLVHGQTRPAKSIPLSAFELPRDGDRAAAAPLTAS